MQKESWKAKCPSLKHRLLSLIMIKTFRALKTNDRNNSNFMNLNIARFAKLFVLLGWAALLGGCAIIPSHIHNEGNAQTAKKAESEMEAFSSNAPAIYG